MNKNDIGFYLHEASGMYVFGVDETENTVIGFIMNSYQHDPAEFGDHYKSYFFDKVSDETIKPSPEVIYAIYRNSRETEYSDIVDEYFKHFLKNEKFSISENLKFIQNKTESIIIDKMSSVKLIGNGTAEITYESIVKPIILPVEETSRLRSLIESGKDLNPETVEDIKHQEESRIQGILETKRKVIAAIQEDKRRESLQSLYMTEEFNKHLQQNKEFLDILDHEFNISIVSGDYFHKGYRLIDSPFVSDNLNQVTTHCQNYKNNGVWLNTDEIDGFAVGRIKEEQKRLPNFLLAKNPEEILSHLGIESNQNKNQLAEEQIEREKRKNKSSNRNL